MTHADPPTEHEACYADYLRARIVRRHGGALGSRIADLGAAPALIRAALRSVPLLTVAFRGGAEPDRARPSVRGAPERLPILSGTLTGVLLYQATSNLDRVGVEALLSETHRVLQPGGGLVIIDRVAAAPVSGSSEAREPAAAEPATESVGGRESVSTVEAPRSGAVRDVGTLETLLLAAGFDVARKLALRRLDADQDDASGWPGCLWPLRAWGDARAASGARTADVLVDGVVFATRPGGHVSDMPSAGALAREWFWGSGVGRKPPPRA